MTMLKILHFPDKRLRQKAKHIIEFTPAIKQHIANMFETMYSTPNTAGLAAVQMNILHRIIVIDLSPAKDQPLCLVNPEITWKSEETTFHEEGCLSVPGGIYEPVERAKEIEFKALDATGKEYTRKADGFLSACVQHEIDHLDGILFVDYLSNFKRDWILRKIKKWQKIQEKEKREAREAEDLVV